MKKLMSILLSLTMIFGMGTSVFAGTTNTENGKLAITQLSNTRYLITDGEGSAVMSVEENEDFLKVYVTENEENNYLLVNKEAGTIYSTYTGKTVGVDEITAESGISTMSIVEQTTHNISYKTLAGLVSSTSSDISIASTIITCIAAAQHVMIATAAGVVVALISGSLTIIVDGIKNASPNHGIKVVVNTEEIKKHQGGRWVTGYRYTIGSISTY